MGLRLYFCPVIGDGQSIATAYRPKVAGLAAFAAVCPSNASGVPLRSFAACLVRAASWATLDADAALDRLFGIDLPDDIETFDDLKAHLQSKTVGDIPPARRTALDTRLTSRGFDTSQITLATTWWQVLRGIYQQMGAPDNDGPRI